MQSLNRFQRWEIFCQFLIVYQSDIVSRKNNKLKQCFFYVVNPISWLSELKNWNWLAKYTYYITMQKRKNCACMNFSLCIWSGTYRKKNHTWASLLTIPTAYRKLHFSRVFSSEYSDIIFGNGSPISFHFFLFLW